MLWFYYKKIKYEKFTSMEYTFVHICLVTIANVENQEQKC